LILFSLIVVQLVVQLWCSRGAVVVQLVACFENCTTAQTQHWSWIAGKWCSGAALKMDARKYEKNRKTVPDIV